MRFKWFSELRLGLVTRVQHVLIEDYHSDDEVRGCGLAEESAEFVL